EIGHPFFLSTDIESAVPTDSEKPFRRGVIEFGPILLLQFHKCFLHDIARSVAIAQNSSGILQQRPFEALEDLVHLRAIDSCHVDLDALHLSPSLTREPAENYKKLTASEVTRGLNFHCQARQQFQIAARWN